jgi:hypothetical protein
MLTNGAPKPWQWPMRLTGYYSPAVACAAVVQVLLPALCGVPGQHLATESFTCLMVVLISSSYRLVRNVYEELGWLT